MDLVSDPKHESHLPLSYTLSHVCIPYLANKQLLLTFFN